MKDSFDREIDYIRISLTDRCNLRCLYCMDEKGIFKLNHEDILTFEEIINVICIAAKLGIKKVRYTGGEPLIRRDLVKLISMTKEIKGIEEICLTTNGILLKKYASDLKKAGLDRINISIDTLKDDKYKFITRLGNINDVLTGIDEALKVFKKVKLNVVLIGNFNRDEILDFIKLTFDKNIDVRFIELMPMIKNDYFTNASYINCNEVLNVLKNANIKYSCIVSDNNYLNNSVAKLYHVDGAVGNFGLISEIYASTCANCNRIRLTADGKLKPCLHSDYEINIKGLESSEIEEKLKLAILSKPQKHKDLIIDKISLNNRTMNEIGG